MPGINRQPRGLLDFLQVQAGGRNPDQLSETVRPVVDVEPLYWPDRLRAVIEPTSLATGQIEFIEVPEGEVWKVLSVYQTTNLGTGGYARYSFGLERVQPLGLNGVYFGHAHVDNPAAAAADVAVGIQLPVPLIVTSGQRLVVRMDVKTGGGAYAGDFHVLYVLIED